jgi:hypothetical protein
MIPIKLEMSLKARNLLGEEYPLSEQFIGKIEDNRYVFDGWVSAYDGIGRFVMGLPGEVCCAGNEGLLRFLETKKNNGEYFWE